MTDTRLIRLQQIAEMVRVRAIAELDANRRAEQDLERQVVELRSVGGDCTPGAFHRAGRETVWLQWRDSRIVEINRERALLRVARDDLVQAAGRAAARVQVLEQLANRQR
jgi:hypothetical protein